MKLWVKRLGLVFALPLVLVLGLALWLGIKLMLYKQVDDAAYVASKAAYLKTLAALPSKPRPNVLIILYDDLGLGDLGFTGSRAIKTPNIDALAKGGVVLRHYYAPSPVCSPSRAALLTGRLAPRAGLPNVVFPSDNLKRLSNILPGDNIRLPAEEVTIADMLGAAGYRTAMVGKWHMGDKAPSLPRGFGFQSYFGALYSNDMQPFALYRDEQIVVRAPADQTRIDRLYTDEAVKQIAASKPGGKPFFLYFAHNFPHIPLYAAPALQGRSAAGLYGDIVEGLDDGVGRMVAALKASGQYDNSIIILTSDNGPWYEGSAGAMRGRKGQVYEGGVRVPFLIHWPQGLAGGRQIDAMAMGSDIVPTLLDWLGLPVPSDRAIDGLSLRPMLEARAQKTHDLLYFYSGRRLMAVSDGRFKYHAVAPYLYVISGAGFGLPSQQGPWLFDLSVDADESYNVAMKYPDAAARLKAALDAKNAEMQRNPRGWKEVS